jgi:hypothetical protein
MPNPNRPRVTEGQAAKDFRALVAALEKQMTLLFTHLDDTPAVVVKGATAAITKTAQVLKGLAADDRQADLVAQVKERVAFLGTVLRSRAKAKKQGEPGGK